MVRRRLVKLHEIAKLKRKDVEKIARYQETPATDQASRPQIGLIERQVPASLQRTDLLDSKRAEETIGQLAAAERAGPSRSPDKSTSSIEPSQGKSLHTSQDKAVQMRENPSAEKLRPNDDLESDSSCMEERARVPRYVLVGWDSNRTKIMLCLMVLLLLWACIYFPLITS